VLWRYGQARVGVDRQAADLLRLRRLVGRVQRRVVERLEELAAHEHGHLGVS